MGIFIAIVKLLPTIIQLVIALEQVLSASGQGQVKLGIVTGVLEAVSEEASENEITGGMPKEKWLLFVAGIVTRIVALFNGAGIFKKQ